MGKGQVREASGEVWRIAADSGAVPVRLEPNERLRWQPAADSGGGYWESIGARPGFRLDCAALPRPLPAGWYELRGRLQVEGGDVVLPSLFPRYVADSALTSAELTLPEPDASGHIDALLMFFDAVRSVTFYPSVCASRFRMRDFSLRRVSRLRALRVMLGGHAGRAMGWGRAVAGRGLKRATDKLYADYRQRMRPQGASEYDVWTRMYDTFGPAELAAFAPRAQALGTGAPLISVLVPVYDTPEPWLRRCLDSVLAQAYGNWELCIADDASPAPHVTAVLQEYARRDPRIRVIRRQSNGHISAASNTALEMARGDFIALLDHDDELRPHALLRVAETVTTHPDAGLVYSDEDKLDADGRRFDPNFKPDWNLDLLRGQNYVCHLAVLCTALVRAVGGFRTGFEGSQDHDLILRCSERITAQQVVHIPEILYHWRAVEGSTALGSGAKGYAMAAGARAVAEHLERVHAGATVVPAGRAAGLYRVHWPVPDPAPKISLIVPTRDRADLLRTCVESILAQSTYPNFEVVVVDNQSHDTAALAYLRELQMRKRVRVLRYEAAFNYSAINNWTARQCDGVLLGLVNNDIEVITPGWLEEMAAFALRRDVGAVGAMLYYPDDTIQHAGVLLGIMGIAGHIDCGMPRGYEGHGRRALVAQDLSAVTAACLLVRRTVFDEVGGLDEALPVAFNDVDFCLRIRDRGYHNVWTPFAELYHHESASRGKEDTLEKLSRFAGETAFMRKRWGAALRADPAYNPNLSLQSHNFRLAFPPRGRAWED